MSENRMIAGYAIKMGKVGSDRIDYLYDHFDDMSLNHWQWMYDDSGHECIVYLVDADGDFCGDLNVRASFSDMQHMLSSAIEFSNESPQFNFIDDLPEPIFFAMAWYTGAEMGSIFE